MKININKEKFNDIENSFTRLKENESEVNALSKISDALSSLTGKTIVVNTIRPESKNQDCFVMSVYPDESVIDAIVDAILTEKNDSILGQLWNSSSKWNIEIDTRILSKDVGLDEKELTALLLHEVGHIIYSNTIPFRIAKVLRFEFAKVNMLSKALIKDSFFKKLLYFPILNACNSTKNKNSIKEEIKSDKYSAQAGYGVPLSTAMDKIIIFMGNTSADDEMKELTDFVFDSITSLQNRQNKLVRRNMLTMIASTPSVFAKKMITPFVNSLHGGAGAVTENVKDTFIENKIAKITDDFYASEAFFNRLKKLKRIDPADIDYIALELNNIKSNDDKMMIVSYIYNKIDTIDYYIALIDSENPRYIIPHSRDALVAMRDRLDKYRMAAINRKLPEVNYGISIQFPTGYDG